MVGNVQEELPDIDMSVGGEEVVDVGVENLGVHLKHRFEQLVSDRQLQENEWLKDLRQFKGIHESDTKTDADPEGSEAFYRLTRTKVVSTNARVVDLLFPGGGDKNWKADPTNNPKLPDPVVRALELDIASMKYQELVASLQEITETDIQIMQQEGRLPDLKAMGQQLSQGIAPPELKAGREELLKAVKGEAVSRSKLMAEVMDDQLTEGKYRKVIKRVVHSGHLFGTGWLKGPLVHSVPFTAWGMDEETGEWIAEQKTIPMPFFEYVPVWDVYPDSMDVDNIEQCEGIYQRYVMTKQEVRALTKRESFKNNVIKEYLKNHPQGDTIGYRTHESELRALTEADQGTLTQSRSRRFEVIEYTGWADGELLNEVGMEIAEDELDNEFKVNVWIIGNIVIKAEFHPYDASEIDTYHQYVFEHSDTSIFGVSIPSIMRDAQKMLNAGLQALTDNMGDAAEAILEVNVDLLDPSEIADVDAIADKKIILRTGKGLEAQYAAVRKIQGESRITEFLAYIELARDLADESTALPRYAGGDSKVGGAGETARGLSMLMQQANVVLKDPIANFDEGITKPFLRALYHWNMQFSKRDEIKGDYTIVPTGSTSLMAKEIHSEQLESFAQGTNNPVDGPWIKRGELNRERARVKDLDPAQYVYTDEEYMENMRQINANAPVEDEAKAA